MKNEALDICYTLSVEEGYDGDINMFKKLLYNNNEAFQVAYKIFKREGYKKSIQHFAFLVGKNRVNMKRISAITGYPDKKLFIEKIKDEKTASEYYDLTFGNYENVQNKSSFLKSVKDDKNESEKTLLRVSELEEETLNYKTSALFMYSLNSSSLLQNIILIVFLVLFLIRYMIYGTVWSVKQLKK
jgi:hypothetical protein